MILKIFFVTLQIMRGGTRKNSGRKAGKTTELDKKIQRYCNHLIKELLQDKAIEKMTVDSIIKNEQKIKPCVYIIKDKTNGFYKVGFTSNWKKRLQQYKTHGVNFVPIVQVYTPKARQLETSVHNIIAPDRVAREWYDIKDKTVIEIITYLTKNV